MKKFFLLIITLAFVVVISFFYSKEQDRTKNYLDIANAGLSKLVVKYAKEFKLRLVGAGGAFHGGLNGFVYRFNASKPEFSVGNARFTYVTIKEAMLDYVNSTEELRPYLVAYPFPVGEFKVSIGYPEVTSVEEEEKEKRDGKQRIDFVFEARGKIFYDFYSLINQKYEDVYIEDYEEAKRIVEIQKK